MTIVASNIDRLPLTAIRTDGGTQPRAQMDMMYVADLAQAIQDGAYVPAIITYYDGSDYWLADGFHRYHASQQLGRDAIDAEVRQGTRRDAVLCSVGANATHGLRRTNADKRRAVETLLNDPEWVQWSDREIARRCGVHHDMVASIRQSLSGGIRQIDESRFVQRNGTTYAMNTASIGRAQVSPLLSEHDASLAGYRGYESWQEAQSWEEKRRNVDNIPIAVPHISSKNNEWYTPPKYIEAARSVMGKIDLDPASCEEANQVVQAERYYTIRENGLIQPWSGRVWLNPPYGRSEDGSNQDIWSSRLIYQYEEGHVDEAILLVNAAVDTKWFQRLFAYPVCFPAQRINFSTPEPTISGSTHGSALVYFGIHRQRFVEVFGQFGTVVKRW